MGGLTFQVRRCCDGVVSEIFMNQWEKRKNRRIGLKFGDAL